MRNRFMVFSKHLVGLPLREVGERLAAMGVGAIDLTVRPGGHVEPEQADEGLPRAAEQLRLAGVRIGMISTGITDAADKRTDRILRAAVACGIRHYKLGYFPYAGFGSLRRIEAEVVARLTDIAALNAELGLHAGFHNHSGDCFGACLGDIERVLRNVPPAAVGLYLDPAHATVEGSGLGWLMGMDLLADRITMLAVKDFRWVEGKHRFSGGRRQSAEFCPLADGNTPWPDVLEVLRRLGFDGPISFHSEYQGSHCFANLTVEQVFQQTARDVALFETWCARTGEGATLRPVRDPSLAMLQNASIMGG